MQRHESIRTNNIEQFRIGILFPDSQKRINGIGSPIAIQLQAGRHQALIAGTGGYKHFPAVFSRSGTAFVSGTAGRNDKQTIHIISIQYTQRRSNMTAVNRIKTAAQNADTLFFCQSKEPPDFCYGYYKRKETYREDTFKFLF